MPLLKRPPAQADKPFLLRMMIYGDGSEGKTTTLASFLKNPNLKVIWIAADATTEGSLNFVDDVWGVKLTKGQLLIANVPAVPVDSLDGKNDSEVYLAVHKPLLGDYPAYDAFDGSLVSLKKPANYGEDTLIIIDGLSSYNSPILFKGEMDYAVRMAGQKKTQYDGAYNDQKKLLHKLLAIIKGAGCHIALTAHNVSAHSAEAVLTPYGLKNNFPNLVVKSMVSEFTRDFNWVLAARKVLSTTGKPDRFLVGFDSDWFTKTSFNEVTFEKDCAKANLDPKTGKPKTDIVNNISLKRLPCDLTHDIYPFLKGD